jgi:cation diffusion facilitator family transporter
MTNANNTNSALQSKKRLMIIVLIISILLFAVKFIAYFLTNSSAILTDAIESIVNIITGAFALYSINYAAKPKDEDHPYGHGKIEFFSSGLEGSMILLAGIAMVFKGAVSFFEPDHLTNVDIGLYMSLFAGTINLIVGKILIKKGKNHKSHTLIAEGEHLLSDTYSSAAIVVGLIIIFFTKIIWIDYVITLGMGVFIAYTGFKLVRTSIDNLLDKADLEELNKLIATLESHKKNSWIDMHNLRVVKYGDHLHVDCHVTLPWFFSLEEAHDEVDLIGKLIKEQLGEKIEFFIHADPCVRPLSCGICPMQNCKERKAEFVKRIVWDMKNVLPDMKHRA